MGGVAEIRTRLTAPPSPLISGSFIISVDSQPSHGAEEKWGLVRFPVWPGSKLLFHGEVPPLLSPKHYNHLTKTWAFAQIKTSIMHKCFSVLSCSISGLGWKTLSTFCTFSTRGKKNPCCRRLSCKHPGRQGELGGWEDVERTPPPYVWLGMRLWWCWEHWSAAGFAPNLQNGVMQVSFKPERKGCNDDRTRVKKKKSLILKRLLRLEVLISDQWIHDQCCSSASRGQTAPYRWPQGQLAVMIGYHINGEILFASALTDNRRPHVCDHNMADGSQA